MPLPATILYVEDNETARAAVGQLLRRHGFRVCEAGTGAEALRRAAEAPDLVLLDVHLPDADGFDLCRRLKATAATAAAPVLLISGRRIGSDDHVQGLECGASGYLTKPIDPSVIVAQVKALLRARRAEEDQARLVAIVESSEDAIIGKDLDGNITSWNAAAEEMFGYAAAEVQGRSAALLLPPGREDEAPTLMARLRRGESIRQYETVCARKDGRRIDVSMTLSPVRDAGGRVVGASVIARDVTERKHLEEQYRQSQKMEAVGRLAGGIAHDFNNLLTIINGFAELLLAASPSDGPARESLDTIRKAGQRAAALTRQLLAFSRKQVLAPRVLDLNAVVIELEKMLRRVIGEDVQLAANLQPNLGRVRADPGQVEQTLMNLAVNARDAMPRGGKLTITTRDAELDDAYTRSRAEVRPGRYVLLAVSDTGHGMAPEVRARIFEPFFTTKEKGHGSGLGLATVYGIVTQSGGHVEVYSEPGHGTAFKIYLPRVEEAAPAGPLPAAGAAPRGSETVLLVEDDDGVRALARLVLEGSGYAVLEAGSGDAALRVAGRHAGPIHLLVTDVVMPGLGGRQLAERLFTGHPEMRLLYMSGYTDDAVVRHGVIEKQVYFLQKPFSAAALARKVREVLDARREGA